MFASRKVRRSARPSGVLAFAPALGHLASSTPFVLALALSSVSGASLASDAVGFGAGTQPREVALAIRNTGAEACGVEVNLGDGNQPRRRLQPNEVWNLTHTYGAAGSYEVRVLGVAVSRGLRSIEPCGIEQSNRVSVSDSQVAWASGGAAAPVAAAPVAAAPVAAAPVAAAPVAAAPVAAAPVAAAPVAAAPVAAPSPALTAGQDLLVFFSKRQPELELIATLDGDKRLANPRNTSMRPLAYCVLKFPNSYGAVSDEAADEAAGSMLLGVLMRQGYERRTELMADRAFRRVSCLSGTAPNVQLDLQAIVIVQRQAVEELKRLSPRFEPSYELFAQLKAEAVVEAAARSEREARLAAEAAARARAEFDELAAAGSRDKVLSLNFGQPGHNSTVKFCTLEYSGAEGATVLGYANRGIATVAPEFRALIEQRKAGFDTRRMYSATFKTLDEFFQDKQKNPANCDIYVDFPANIKRLVSALDGQGRRIPYQVGALVASSDLRDEWARRRGFADFAQSEFGDSIKASAQELKTLAEFGITNAPAFERAGEEVKATGYNDTVSVRTVLAYLRDKAEAAGKPGTSANAIRDARLQAERVAAQQAAEAARKRREEFAKEYPFIAVLTCGMPRHINIMACFAGGRLTPETELELGSGARQSTYKAYNLRNIGEERGDGFYIDLRRDYLIRAQNSHETLILGLKIIDRVSGQVLEESQAGQYKIVQSRGRR